jgi:hypothetical protein
MRSKAATPDEYIDSLPDDRRQAVAAIREAINKNIPKGFRESIAYGMLSWSVPHEIYPPGYHCDPKLPLGLMGLASQKNYISFYHMGLYAGAWLDWFQTEWPKHTTRKLDMGKCCVRFKKPDDIPIKLIGQLASKMTPQQWVATYEKALKH